MNGLSLSVGTLSPSFSSSTLSYTATVPSATASVVITPLFGVAVNVVHGSNVQVSGVGYTVNLSEGENLIDLVASGRDLRTTTYSLRITRLGVAELTGLTISQGTLSPAFDSDTLAYNADVGRLVSSCRHNADLRVSGHCHYKRRRGRFGHCVVRIAGRGSEYIQHRGVGERA